jgi:hypothetical protein
MAKYQKYSNVHEDQKKNLSKTIKAEDRARLRDMAKRWMEIALSDDMHEKKTAWKSVHDLKPKRPVILFETLSVAGFVSEEELLCEDELLRNVEKTMLYSIKQHETVNDDLVIEPWFRIAWKVGMSDHGVKIIEHHAENSMGYLSNFPIKNAADINKLKPRTYTVNREESLILKAKLEDIFGDILPVVVGNYDNFFSDTGFTPFTGNNFVGITMDLFKLIGYENMMLWPIECPDDLHQILGYLRDDKISLYRWLKEEGLLALNTDNQLAGPSSYGYVSDLPQPGSKEEVEFKDLWVWPESQETTSISPEMFDEVYLPYIAEVSNMFGLSYYGCCEAIDDRFEQISKAIPNLRTVSVSGWNDLYRVGELLGNDYVYCRKPTPSLLSGKTPNWDSLKKDIVDTFNSAKDGSLEIVVRDVYDIDGDMARISKWVEMTRSIIGI